MPASMTRRCREYPASARRSQGLRRPFPWPDLGCLAGVLGGVVCLADDAGAVGDLSAAHRALGAADHTSARGLALYWSSRWEKFRARRNRRLLGRLHGLAALSWPRRSR